MNALFRTVFGKVEETTYSDEVSSLKQNYYLFTGRTSGLRIDPELGTCASFLREVKLIINFGVRSTIIGWQDSDSAYQSSQLECPGLADLRQIGVGILPSITFTIY